MKKELEQYIIMRIELTNIMLMKVEILKRMVKGHVEVGLREC